MNTSLLTKGPAVWLGIALLSVFVTPARAQTEEDTRNLAFERRIIANERAFFEAARIADIPRILEQLGEYKALSKMEKGDQQVATLYFAASKATPPQSLRGFQLAWEQYESEFLQLQDEKWRDLLEKTGANEKTAQGLRVRAALHLTQNRSPLSALLSAFFALDPNKRYDFSVVAKTDPTTKRNGAVFEGRKTRAGEWMLRFDPTYETLRRRVEHRRSVREALEKDGLSPDLITRVFDLEDALIAADEKRKIAALELAEALLQGTDDLQKRLADYETLTQKIGEQKAALLEKGRGELNLDENALLLLRLRQLDIWPLYGATDSFEGAFWVMQRAEFLKLQ